MPTDQEVLQRVTVRLVTDPDERRQFDDMMKQWHYLESSRMVGEQLRQVAEVNGVWVALLGWSAGTLKSAPRRAWVGWDAVQERQRLHLIAQNARFCILPGNRVPNLASRILALSCARLSADWEATYGHPVLVAETFVDQARFKGTCYLAAGWQEIGTTKGVARETHGWKRHGVVKRLLVRELCAGARELLVSSALPEDQQPRLTPQEICLSGPKGLLQILKDHVPDTRKRKGRRYRLKTLLGLIIAGMLAGQNDIEHIAAWVRGLSASVLKRFGCNDRDKEGKIRAPCANTYRYVLQDIDPIAVDRAIRIWLAEAGIDTTGVVIAIDGKTLRGSASLGEPARKAVSFFLHDAGITIAQSEVPTSTTEVPKAREMIADLNIPLEGSIMTADAAHTCPETAQEAGKRGRITSSPSKAINPSWRLRWPNVSKPSHQDLPSPMTTDTAETNIEP